MLGSDDEPPLPAEPPPLLPLELEPECPPWLGLPKTPPSLSEPALWNGSSESDDVWCLLEHAPSTNNIADRVRVSLGTMPGWATHPKRTSCVHAIARESVST